MIIMKSYIKQFFKILLTLILTTGIISSTIAAIMTTIPETTSSKACLIGYKAICSFTPISTIILIFITLTLGVFLHHIQINQIKKKVNRKTIIN
jgi:hypothetical protein